MAYGKAIIFSFPIVFSLFAPVSAQHKYAVYFNKVLATQKLVYTPPSGFEEVEPYESFFLYSHSNDRDKYLHPLHYRLISDKDNLLIGVESAYLNPKFDSNKVLNAVFPGQREDNNYLLWIRSKADTLHGNKVEYYSYKKSLRLYGADHAGTYTFELEIPYAGKFNRCRIVFMQKDGCANAEIYYFYNDRDKKTKRQMDKLAEETYKMIRFKK